MSVISKDKDPDTYIGLKFPLDYGRDGFFSRTKTALEQAKHNIKNLLLTQKGERLGNPTFGSDLHKVLFEMEGGELESNIEEAIRSAISEFLPFINVENVESTFSSTNKNAINVRIKFTLNIDTTSQEELSLNLGNYSDDETSFALDYNA